MPEFLRKQTFRCRDATSFYLVEIFSKEINLRFIVSGDVHSLVGLLPKHYFNVDESNQGRNQNIKGGGGGCG